jgi:NADH-ubiquinone oxidoreductase chain 2
LAYSTISHIGFILLAIAINTEQSIDSFIFYIIQYTITNLNIFLILLAISYVFYNKNIINKDIKYISELKGFFVINPILSISFGLCLFSMAGIPPLIGFFSKQFVLYSALQNGYYFISIIAILVSVISASYYLQIIKNIFYLNEDQQINNSKLNLNNTNLEVIEISNIHSYLISILSLIILFFFIKPTILLNCTQLLSLSLFYI